jgi:hypothetical protein
MARFCLPKAVNTISKPTSATKSALRYHPRCPLLCRQSGAKQTWRRHREIDAHDPTAVILATARYAVRTCQGRADDIAAGSPPAGFRFADERESSASAV